MAADVDPELLTDAVLMHVDDLKERGSDWLRAEFDRVLEATMGGDEFVTSINFKGESNTAEREVPAAFLLAVLTQARKRLKDQDGGTTATGAMLIPRLTDFPLS
jgi:hypothetical protein